MKASKDKAPEPELYERFSIDGDDLKILKIFQENPSATHVEIANRINKSQPAVGARVTKLERKDILATQKGVNFKAVKEKLYLLMVDVQTRNPNPIMEEALLCPFIINAFKRSGTKNLVVLLTSTKMEKLEMIIDKHFRSNPLVASVETAFIVDIAKDFILPVSWDFLKLEHVPCGETCCQDVKRRKGKIEI